MNRINAKTPKAGGFDKIFQLYWSVGHLSIALVGSDCQVSAREAAVAASPAATQLTSEGAIASRSPAGASPANLSQLPNPIPPRTPPEPIPALPQPEQPLPPLTAPPPALEIRPDIPGSITVKAFVFEGNTAFTAEELAEVTKEFTNRPITFAELLQAEAAVTKLYTDAGYLNSGAVIPAEQTLSKEEAVIKIQIIEGEVEDIQVRGTNKLNPEYVRSRLAIAARKPLNRDRLLEALQLLQLNPLIATVSAELSAGSRPERSFLQVRIKEANTFSTEVFADNGRAPSVGSFRRGIRINEANLLGAGDSLSLSYTNTEGSDSYDSSYTIPFNPRNGTITISAGGSDTRVIEPPFNQVDITGDSRYLELNLRQPVVLTPTREFALGLTGSLQQSDTKLLGEKFPLSPGADENGRTRVAAVRFFQEYTQRSRDRIFAARSQFSLGVGILNATVSDEPPDSRFLSWRGQVQYVQQFAPDTLLVLRSDAQLANQTLVPLEQFSLGGFRNIRGYRQDVLLTDIGVLASAELFVPVLRVKQLDGLLQVVPFVDFGFGTNRGATADPDTETLLGAGLGLQWQMGRRLTARLDYGIPLTDIESSNKTLQEKGIYFSINYNFF